MNRKIFLKSKIKDIIKIPSSILIFGGGQMEREVFQNEDHDITFLNIDRSDLENVNFKTIISSMHNNNIDSNSYDYVLANASIHHASKPHNSILEMYRIAKKGVLIFEGNDSLLMKISNKFGFSEIFEKSAINNFQGGVDNSEIPNFIYRWTEREINKLISSYKPEIKHKIFFYYEFDIGNIFKKSSYKKKIVEIIFKIFFFFFPKQKNLMCIHIDKINSKLRKD